MHSQHHINSYMDRHTQHTWIFFYIDEVGKKIKACSCVLNVYNFIKKKKSKKNVCSKLKRIHFFSSTVQKKYLSIFLCPTGLCDVFVSLQMDEFVYIFVVVVVCDLITSQLGRVSCNSCFFKVVSSGSSSCCCCC